MRIGKISKPLVVDRIRQPLDIALSVESVNSRPLTQSADLLTGIWYPDRAALNGLLRLHVALSAVNPETGRAVTLTPDVYWYIERYTTTRQAYHFSEEDSGKGTISLSGGTALPDGNGKQVAFGIDTESVIVQNATTEQVTSDNELDDYFIPAGSSDLCVRKNVTPGQSVTILCRVAYTDTNTGVRITKEERVILSCENVGATQYSIDIDCEQTVRYDPLRDASSRKTLTAVVRRGKDVLAVGTQVAVFWYLDGALVDDSATTPDEVHPCYVSGQGTATLTLDAMLCDRVGVTARFALVDAETGQPQQDSETGGVVLMPHKCTRSVLWSVPRLSGDIIPLRGRFIKSGDTMKQYRLLLRANGSDLPDNTVADNIITSWKLRPSNKSYANATNVGLGQTVDIPVNTLRPSNASYVELSPEVDVLGPYRPLTVEVGGQTVLVADGGNGPFVVGRVPME